MLTTISCLLIGCQRADDQTTLLKLISCLAAAWFDAHEKLRSSVSQHLLLAAMISCVKLLVIRELLPRREKPKHAGQVTLVST